MGMILYLVIGGAALYYLFAMGGIGQIQGMIGNIGGGGNGGGNIPDLPSAQGITDQVNAQVSGALKGVGNNFKVSRNVNNTGGPVNQTNTQTQSHRIVQQNGKTLFESNLGRMSYN